MGRVLQDDENFLVELVNWRGSPAVRKSAKPSAPKTRADRLKNDVLGMRFFAELAKNHQNLELYAPKVYEFEENFYIREYIESEQFLDEAASFDEAKGKLDKFAKLLADVDRIEPGEQVGYFGSTNYRHLEQSIPRWADENVHDKLITEAQAENVRQIAAGLGKYLKPRIAHGDMSAYKHSYLMPDGKVALIDFENFTTGAARYFDVAWSYTRLWSFATSTDIPRYFLASFMSQAETAEHQSEQLMAVLIQRTLGMQKDADKDLEKKGVDYRDRSKELLDLVLQNKLELLHD